MKTKVREKANWPITILLFYLICQKHILNGVVNGAVK